MTMDVIEKATAARQASLELANVSGVAKNEALEAMANAVDKNRQAILEANSKDIEKAEKLCAEGKLSEVLVDRLKLSDTKINAIIEGIRSVAALDDPIGKTLSATELDKGLELYKVTCPIGVIGVVFESRPDVVPQVASLCLKSGNAVIMKGGSEAMNSNRTLARVLADAAESITGIRAGCIQLVETREDVKEMLELDEYISLMIPRGSNEFVRYIQENTKIAVLGHAEGICHTYVHKDADANMAIDVCFDAKVQYPAVCNAMETLLVDEEIAGEFLPKMAKRYVESGVELRVDEKAKAILKDFEVVDATDEDWATEYNDLILSIKVVSGYIEAIKHINTYSSGHTDVIITNDEHYAEIFMDQVDSSSVMHNCSTRFADGFRYGLGAEVGISTNKIHARGPVGLEGLVIHKYILKGRGQVVADYVGPNARKYTHQKLKKTWR